MKIKKLCYFLIRIILISILTFVGVSIFQIDMLYLSPFSILVLLIIMYLMLFIIYNKNFSDFIKKYSCVVLGVIIGLIIKNNEIIVILKILDGNSFINLLNKFILLFLLNRYYYVFIIISFLIILSLFFTKL